MWWALTFSGGNLHGHGFAYNAETHQTSLRINRCSKRKAARTYLVILVKYALSEISQIKYDLEEWSSWERKKSWVPRHLLPCSNPTPVAMEGYTYPPLSAPRTARKIQKKLFWHSWLVFQPSTTHVTKWWPPKQHRSTWNKGDAFYKPNTWAFDDRIVRETPPVS